MKILDYLVIEPQARERRNKNRAIANVLKTNYPELKNFDKTFLVRIIREANTLDREWRKVLQEKPELRGSDYNQKDVLEEKKLIELGYRN